MARIIESSVGSRRLIKMSVDDIISIVKDYQRIVPRTCSAEDVRSYLSDTIIFIPEEV
jgi:hypothetical protein